MSKFVNYINEDVIKALLVMITSLYVKEFGEEAFTHIKETYLTEKEPE